MSRCRSVGGKAVAHDNRKRIRGKLACICMRSFAFRVFAD